LLHKEELRAKKSRRAKEDDVGGEKVWGKGEGLGGKRRPSPPQKDAEGLEKTNLHKDK